MCMQNQNVYLTDNRIKIQFIVSRMRKSLISSDNKTVMVRNDVIIIILYTYRI